MEYDFKLKVWIQSFTWIKVRMYSQLDQKSKIKNIHMKVDKETV